MPGPDVPEVPPGSTPGTPQVSARTRRRSSLVLVIFALFLAFLITQGMLTGRRRSFLPVGSVAPDAQLARYQGGTLSLSELRGKVVMLDFWATWCPPCIKEMPHLLKLAKEYESRGVVFVAANRDDPSEAQEAVSAFIARRAPTLTPYVAFADAMTSQKFKVRVLPTLYFLDREGRVFHVGSGYATESQLREHLEKALEAP